MKKLLSFIFAFLLVTVLILPVMFTCFAISETPAENPVITADTLNMLLQSVITIVIIPAIVFLGKAVFEWLKTKTNNAKLNKYIDDANEAVSTAVAEVMQTFVSTLKNQGKWTNESAKLALQMAKDKAVEIMGVAALKALPEIVGDVEAWLTSKVEAATLALKSTTPTALLPISCQEATYDG